MTSIKPQSSDFKLAAIYLMKLIDKATFRWISSIPSYTAMLQGPLSRKALSWSWDLLIEKLHMPLVNHRAPIEN